MPEPLFDTARRNALEWLPLAQNELAASRTCGAVERRAKAELRKAEPVATDYQHVA